MRASDQPTPDRPSPAEQLDGTGYEIPQNVTCSMSAGGPQKLLPHRISLLRLAAYGQRRCHFFPLPQQPEPQPYAESLHLTFDQSAEAIRLRLFGAPDFPAPYMPMYPISIGRSLMAEPARLGPTTGDETDCGRLFRASPRGLKLPEGTMPGLDQSKWYAAEIGAIYETGLLEGSTTIGEPPKP